MKGRYIILAILFMVSMFWINLALTPNIYVTTIDGKDFVYKVGEKETFRPLSKTDYLEGNIIREGENK